MLHKQAQECDGSTKAIKEVDPSRKINTSLFLFRLRKYLEQLILEEKQSACCTPYKMDVKGYLYIENLHRW